MGLIYTSRIGCYLKNFASCILLACFILNPGKSTAQCSAPGVVTTTVPTNITCSSFLANWSAPSGTVTNYIVELAKDPGFTDIVAGPLETDTTATFYSFTGLIAGASYYYRVMAVDSVSPGSVCYSASYSAYITSSTANLLPPSATCQCTPVNDLTCATDYITNVTINTLNNNSGCSTGGYGYYFPTGSQTTNLAIAGTYSLNVTTGGANSGTFGAAVWFDFNQNGSLLDEGEFLNISSALSTGTTVEKTFIIPPTATPGFTAMRVRYGLSEIMNQSDACTMTPNTVDGETEDYTVCLYVPTNITQLPQNTIACQGSTPVLFLGATGSGLTYQWYISPSIANTGGTAIAGATNSNYTPPTTTLGTFYYYCVLTNICNTAITTPSSSSVTLTVYPPPTITGMTATPSVLCSGNPLDLIAIGASGPGTPTYTWSGPDGYTATTASDTNIYTPISIAATGNYSLTVVYPGAGCNTPQIVSPLISVNDSPSVTSVTAAISPLCVQGTLTLTAGSTTGTGAVSSYIWSGPGGFADTTTTGITTFTVTSTAASGIYNLVVTYPGLGCYSGSKSTSPVEVDTEAAAITGNAAICYLGSTTFGNTTLGGTWTSNTTGVATINDTNGVIATVGSAGGTTNIVYTVNNSCGTTIANVVLTVNPLPSIITENVPVCNGLSICLSDSTSGGAWIAGNSNVTINGSSGCITGSIAGTSPVTYTLPTSCFTTTIVTVNPLPANISGSNSICLGLTTSLTDATPGGSWSSSNPSVGSVGTSGIVTGNSVGTAVITYTLPTGCIIKTIVTVNPNPLAITGTQVVCATQTTQLTDLTTGGIWSSSSTSQATVGTTGLVLGVGAGTPTITYSLPTGCIATIPVTVNPLSAILGYPGVCLGLTATISDATSGGTWSSSNTSIVTVGSSSGVLASVGPLGTSIIVYSISATGCSTSLVVSVNSNPAVITGNIPVCAGNNINLTDVTSGGKWSSSNTAVATVGSGTGTVTGLISVLASATATITYTLPTGCTSNATVTVNPNPVAITGIHNVCSGLSTCLTDVTVGGTWSTSNTTIATIGTAGCITTVAPSGTVIVTYSIPTGCNISTIFTINPLPGIILGPDTICSGSAITLSDAGGGTWSSSSTAIVTVGSSSGIVSGIAAGPATATVTYTLPTGCITTSVITVNPLPSAILGATDAVCAGLTISFSDNTSGGIWSSTNTNATVGGTSGTVTGANAGTATISYTIVTGCAATQVVTINPLPVAISGSLSLCLGLTTNLTDGSGGGSWSSSIPDTASIVAGTGAVTANSLGTSTITYILPTGCLITAPVTVNSLPANINFVSVHAVCPGSSLSLTDPSTGGLWSSSSTATATVGSGSGIVTGVSGGTVTITYTVGTGCVATTIATIYPAPATIIGAPNICLGSSPTLSDATTPGTWSSTSTSVVTIGSTSGTIASLAIGTSIISYTLPVTGCATSLAVNVVGSVNAISGSNNVCSTFTTTLTDATIGGTWSSSNTNVTVNGTSGAVTGVAVSGTTTITYTLGTCLSEAAFTVNPLPANITGTTNVCVGLTTNLTDVTSGITWSSSNANASVGSGTGVVTGANSGTATISCIVTSTGCAATSVVTVNVTPSGITGGNVVCSGASIGLSDAFGSGVWSSSNTAVASVGSGGLVTGHGSSAATATISYILPTGCYATTVVSVIVTIPGILGTATNCPQFNISLSDVTSGGAWSSSNTSIANVNSSGLVSDVAPGTATISYSIGGICTVTKVASFTPVPAISGATNICFGATSTLSDISGGGTWTSSSGVISIGGTSGVVSSIATGTATISYILPGGCNTSTTVAVVNSLPNLKGIMLVCKGSTTSLSDSISGGTWTSGNTTIANVSTTTGIVTGVAQGAATISYKLGTGCTEFTNVTVNPLPANISGPTAMCQNASATLNSITLNDVTPGGTWSSATLGITGTGTSITVTASSLGTNTISYTLSSTGCAVGSVISVNPAPSAIVGPNSVCYLSGVIETDPTSGGTWNSSNESIVYVSAGATFGVQLGTANISYVLSTTGCSISKPIVVDSLPSLISGVTTICASTSTMLTDVSVGGTWSSDNAVVGSINTITGTLTGVSAGTANVTYTLASGCATDTVVTILYSPVPMTGTPGVCLGNTTNLSDATSDGSWSSSNTSVATVGLSSGLVNGLTLGTATISYTIGDGCSNTSTFSVNPFPASITGSTNVCPGATITLNDDTTGGAWSSSNTSVATVNSSTGVVTGISGGEATITYTTPAGCYVTTTVNVFGIVGPLTSAANEVCLGLTLNLDDTTSGGTWSSSNTAVLTIGSASGIVTGTGYGAATTTYTAVTGCYSTAIITVINGLPSITGTTFSECPGFEITLSDVSVGGIWSSSSANVSVGSSTGIVTGVTAGTANITYSFGAGCTVTTVVTVNGQPITGIKTICLGTSVNLSDVESGGSWTSANTNVFVGSTTGVVTGIASGTANITYFSPLGCTVVTTVSVVTSLPAIVTIPPACVGQTINIFDAVPGGTWSSANTAIAIIGSAGDVIGAGAGTVSITYSLGTGCFTSSIVTINALSPIAGPAGVCKYATISLSDATSGGTWTSSNSNIAIGSSSGVVTALNSGISTITYSLASGCKSTMIVSVSPIAVISGIPNICFPGTTTLTDSVTGGTWISSNTAVATIGSSSGIVIPTGDNATTVITYALPSGCTAITTVDIVSSLPTSTGNTIDCIGVPSVLTNSIIGGTWSSSNTGIATVDMSSGAVTGESTGSAIITYKLGTTCLATTTVSINQLPDDITGSVYVCVGLTNELTDGTSGGFWTSSTTSVATVGSTGIVTGVFAGTATVTYSTPAGCIATTIATVNPLPDAVTGIINICSGSTTDLTDATSGGSWSSSNTSIGSVGAGTGVVSAISSGTTTITYTLPTGCIATTVVNVVSSVNPVTGTPKVCIDATTTLADGLAGGTWSAANTNASVGSASGIVMGLVAGTSSVIYTLGSGCNATIIVTVNAGPPAPLGVAQICYGNTSSLSDATSGGTWSASNGNITIGSSSGLVNSINAGLDTVTYTINTGCKTTSVFTVNALPVVYSLSPGGSYCASGTGVALMLYGSQVGVNYKLYYGSSDIGGFAGTGDTLNLDLHTLAGTYSVNATNNATGCSSNMLDTAVITITPNVIPGVSIASSGGDTVCVGTYTTFTATPVNGGTTPGYQWVVNGVSPGADSSHYSYIPTNGDVVSVILTSNALCVLPDTAITSVVMTVENIKTPSVGISIAPNDTLCAGSVATFTAVDSFGGSAPSFKWYKNGVLTATGSVYSFTPYLPDNDDVIFCKMTSNYTCVTTDTASSGYIQIIVDSSLIPIITMSATPGTIIYPGESDTFSVSVSDAGTAPTYQWLVNQNLIAGATSNMFISDTLTNGDSVICIVRGTGECGLYSFNSAVIIIDSSLNVQQVAVGNSNIVLVPNPNNGSFTIKGTLGTTQDQEVTVEVTDVLGQVIYKNKIMAAGGKINDQVRLSSTLANGMYTLSLHADSQYKVFHLVIEQ